MSKIVLCKMCRKEPASVEVTYGSYQTYEVQILELCSQCSQELWDGDKNHSLKNLVTVGIIYYSIKGFC